MKLKVTIWSKDKETGKRHSIVTHEELGLEEIEIAALQKFKDNYITDDDKEYWAELEETII